MCHKIFWGIGLAKESKGVLGALGSKMNPFEESCPFLSRCMETSSQVPVMCHQHRDEKRLKCMGAFMSCVYANICWNCAVLLLDI